MGETEAQFARRVVRYLLDSRNAVLRVCDRSDARKQCFGLRIEGVDVNSTGPDYLVLSPGDIPIVRTDDMDDVRRWAKHRGGPFFLELKRPGARKRKNEVEQDRWIQLVGGAGDR